VLHGADLLLETFPLFSWRSSSATALILSLVRSASWESRGYDVWPLFSDGLKPFSCFDIDRHQSRFVNGDVQNVMPDAYVNDFLFMRSGDRPPRQLLAPT